MSQLPVEREKGSIDGVPDVVQRPLTAQTTETLPTEAEGSYQKFIRDAKSTYSLSASESSSLMQSKEASKISTMHHGFGVPWDTTKEKQTWDGSPGFGDLVGHESPCPEVNNFQPDPLDILVNVPLIHDFHPVKWSKIKRWSILTVYCVLQLFVSMTATSYVSAANKIQEDFGGSPQVVTLGHSLFIAGNGIGSIFLSPVSDFHGRKYIFVLSTLAFGLLNFGCAYAKNLATLIVFMFLIGAAGSTALTMVAGVVTDLFGDLDNAAQAMGLFVVSANCGPSLGAPIGAWLVENEVFGWRWIYYWNIILSTVFFLGLWYIPETLPRLVLLEAAKSKGEDGEIEVQDLDHATSLMSRVNFFLFTTFQLMFYEPLIFTLALFNGFAYGLLFLYLQGVYDVFVINNHLTPIEASLTYLNFVVGVVLMFTFLPVQTYLFRRDRLRHGKARPEARFLTSLVTVWFFPVSCLWFAYTSMGNVGYWSPIVAGTVLGFVDPLLWLAMLNYITDSYPHVAASAIAAFMTPSFLIAGAFAHVGVLVFDKFPTETAMSIVGYSSIALCVIIYTFYYFGASIRKHSHLAKVA